MNAQTPLFVRRRRAANLKSPQLVDARATPLGVYCRRLIDVCGRLCLHDVMCAGDHVLLESQDFACIFNPKQITIRTRASEKESYDSAPVTLTAELLAEIRYRVHHACSFHIL